MGRRWQDDGSSYPLGVSYVAANDSFNFAVYSKHAERVSLLLYGERDLGTPIKLLALDLQRHRTGRIWHCRVPRAELSEARYYAYSVDGPRDRGAPNWHAFDPEKVLVDPYAEEIFVPPEFARAAACLPGPNAGTAPLGRLSTRTGSLARGTPRAAGPRHEADLVIYELHVGALTSHPSSPVRSSRRGTYAAVVELIPYLRELGVTAVELMPVFQQDPQSGDYWGYSPLSFFAPHAGYASASHPESVADDFRVMIDALHAADLEVLIDVVYDHTVEGNHLGPTYSFKGFDNSTYYLCSGDPDRPYLDFTGTGNTVHCANRHVRRMILDSLRHWRSELGVDGFRFDLASIFARDATGGLALDEDAAPIFGDITSDPALATARLIAEPWDAIGTYQLGRHFPGIEWHQWNGRFRDDVRRFVRGDPGMVPAVMYRIYGSDDLFPDRPPEVFRPYQSINYVAIHDGFTLYDVVAYERKHNLANGHHDTDGADENYSANYGHEGDEGAPAEVLALRKRQARNLLAILFLSNGIPMIRAGDEFLQTQGGNNNPYNQDNETTWLDWRRLEMHRDVHRFTRELIAFRKRHPSVCRGRFWREDIQWFGARGAVDLSPASHAFAYHLAGGSQGDSDLYVMLNMGGNDLPMLVQRGRASDWRRVLDTSLPSPDDIASEDQAPPIHDSAYLVRSRSIVVLVRQPP